MEVDPGGRREIANVVSGVVPETVEPEAITRLLDAISEAAQVLGEQVVTATTMQKALAGLCPFPPWC
jgi:hypothetical protein